MSRKHRWFQVEIVRMLRAKGFDAIPEHAQTDSDIYVPSADLSIEIQRWDTRFSRRTAARLKSGANSVLWLVPEPDFGVSGRSGPESGRRLNRAVFVNPAARVKVHHVASRRQELHPWTNPGEEEVAALSVYGTVAHLDRRAGDPALSTWSMPMESFLDEVLAGRRRWFPVGTPGLPRASGAAWVLESDLAAVQAVLKQRMRPNSTSAAIEAPAVAKRKDPAAPPISGGAPRRVAPPVRPAAPKQPIAREGVSVPLRSAPNVPATWWERLWVWIVGE